MKKSVKAWIKELLSKKFDEKEFQSLFLIDVTAHEKSSFIRVYIDGDQGVKFSDCQHISRYLESYLDESGDLSDNYTLEVSSPGVKRPLEKIRQYPQHIGRTLKVTFEDGTNKTLKLLGVEQNELIFESLPSKEKKEIKEIKTSFDNIKEAVVKISFN